MDARVLEKEKENIKPLVFGRSASKLGQALIETRVPRVLSNQREKFESELSSDELDDPLQVYVDYIAWTHDHYPQGANSESGLLHLLERCTSCFRDTAHYKNDPRYLRIWLEYAEYSKSPRDVFVYLAKKSIGQELALYYEQFASFLESRGSMADAREVYEIGIERNARPSTRLQRSMKNFTERFSEIETSTASSIRNLIVAKQPSASSVWNDSEHQHKKQKLAIHQDDGPATLKDTVFVQNASARLNSTVLATKENRLAAKPWAGEVLKQNEEIQKKAAKFEVFRDDVVGATNDFELREEDDQVYTIVSQPGKPRERICVNMNLLYPVTDEERCLGEVLAMSYLHKKVVKTPERNKYREVDQTFTIPLRDDDTIYRTKSPTITMMSRMATNEFMGMINNAASNLHSDDVTGRDFESSTNYDGFNTETIHVESQDIENQNGTTVATPPTDEYDSDAESSPFVENP